VDKYKQEKGQFNDEIKKLAAQINQLNTTLNDVRSEKEDEKLKFEKLLREAETRNLEKQKDFNNQAMLKDFFEYTKNSMDSMQKKIDFYKEKSENLESLQTRLTEKEKEIIKLKTDHSTELTNQRIRITEEYEEKIETLENKFSNELKAVNERHFNEFKTLDIKLNELRNTGKQLDTKDIYVDTLKQQKEVADRMVSDLKTQLTDLQNINKADKNIIYELKATIEDYKMKNELLKKNYKKP